MAAKKTVDLINTISGRPKKRATASLEEQEVVSYKIPNDLRERMVKLKLERIDSSFIRAAFILLLDKLEK